MFSGLCSLLSLLNLLLMLIGECSLRVFRNQECAGPTVTDNEFDLVFGVVYVYCLVNVGILTEVRNCAITEVSFMAKVTNLSSALTRRQCLTTAVLAGGVGLGIPDLLRLRSLASASDSHSSNSRSDAAVIQIWLGGGPSQFETFDPKPEAPVEYRGPYGAISTRLPGVQICEKLPRVASVLDRAAIIRSVTHATNSHFDGAHWCVTGYTGSNNRASHPSNGSIASRFCGARKPGLPPYVLLSEQQTRNPEIGEVMGPGHLGAGHNPLTIYQDPFVKQFQLEPIASATASLKLADDVTFERLNDRRALLAALDLLPRSIDASRIMDGMDHFQRAALQMITTAEARNAFDLSHEPASTRERYGEHRWGQSALLARRLVEAGVTFVTINTAPDSLCWDWHLNIVNDKRPVDGSQGPSRGMDISGPPLDQAISALVTDLYDRGLDRKVFLVVWGEFGRTPRVNPTGGRDHWGAVMSILVSGGGLKMGQVIGATNAKGEIPTDRPVSPTDILTMMYRHLGVDPHQQTLTSSGRPIPILPDGQVISELI